MSTILPIITGIFGLVIGIVGAIITISKFKPEFVKMRLETEKLSLEIDKLRRDIKKEERKLWVPSEIKDSHVINDIIQQEYEQFLNSLRHSSVSSKDELAQIVNQYTDHLNKMESAGFNSSGPFNLFDIFTHYLKDIEESYSSRDFHLSKNLEDFVSSLKRHLDGLKYQLVEIKTLDDHKIKTP